MNTFRWHLELSALGDLDSLGRLVARALGDVLDLRDDLVALEDLAEDDVAAIEPAGDGSGDEELGAVGVLAAVGHAHETLAGVLELEVLIGELGAVDGLAASTLSTSVSQICRLQMGLPTSPFVKSLFPTVSWVLKNVYRIDIPSLDHEVLDDTVESRALITEALLAGSKSTEVLSGLGDGLAVETDHNAAKLLIAVGDVEVDLVALACSLGRAVVLSEEVEAIVRHASAQSKPT